MGAESPVQLTPEYRTFDAFCNPLTQGTDTVVAGSRPLSRLDSSPRLLKEELRYGLWGVVLWLSAALSILAGKKDQRYRDQRETLCVLLVLIDFRTLTDPQGI